MIEFNARFGDPETQVVLARLRTPGLDCQLPRPASSLQIGPLEWSPDAAVTVIVAARGYPGSPVLGGVVEGLEVAGEQPGVVVLHAGTALDPQGHVVSSGGRVLSVVATGADVAVARARAYRAVGLVHLEGAHHRTDIAAGI